MNDRFLQNVETVCDMYTVRGEKIEALIRELEAVKKERDNYLAQLLLKDLQDAIQEASIIKDK